MVIKFNYLDVSSLSCNIHYSDMEGISDKERLYYLKNYINDANPTTNQQHF